MYRTAAYTLLCLCISAVYAGAGPGRQDSLRGGNGDGRNWWDVRHYALDIFLDSLSDTISGRNTITLRVTGTPSDSLQLDLQPPMQIDSVMYDGQPLKMRREGNVWWIYHSYNRWEPGSVKKLDVYFQGAPATATDPPWSGGLIHTLDPSGNPWRAVSCQGTGASIWWPCKDYQADEPDSGALLRFRTNSSLPVISNGRLVSVTGPDAAAVTTWTWQVSSPVNTYNITFYQGDYISWSDSLSGMAGRLDLDFHALRAHEEKARKHYAVVSPMLECMEYWMGPYPFYKDGYKIVEAPYLGMEHQSAIAYGNGYQMGYRGTDRSGTGIGMLFDFIIIHESGHEWFGNSVTAADPADNWIHEGFTTYSEALFAECIQGREAGLTYARGQWKQIRNKEHVIGTYGVHHRGSSDQYEKGAAVIHMIRMQLGSDSLFRSLLHAIGRTYYHGTVTSAGLETFINQFTGYNFTPLFDQYLRTLLIPEPEYFVKDGKLFYRLKQAVSGLSVPVKLQEGKKRRTLYFTAEWQTTRLKKAAPLLSIPEDYLLSRSQQQKG